MSSESTHHLDIEDLLAAVDGNPGGKDARAHLASCSVCRVDAEHWAAVARGVRHLDAEVVPAATSFFDQALATSPSPAVLSRPATETLRIRRHPRWRALVGVAAAAVLVIGGSWYGLTSARYRRGNRPATPGLVAVNGCSNLAAVSGTLERVNGSDLVLQTSDGQSVAITTTASSPIGSEGDGTLDDVSDGARVLVFGIESNGTITAATVNVGALDKVKPLEPPQPSELNPRATVATVGTVADAHTGGFTMVKSDGTNVAVRTTGSTKVFTLRTLSAQQLQVGGFTVAVGNTPGPGDTLVAGAVQQLPEPISFPQPISGKVGGTDCSPADVVTATLLSQR
jgi:hypothetical protein